MAEYTIHYNLKKPAKNENYNIDVANSNNDIIDEKLYGKVDKKAGKDLSTNDFTNEYKKKLDTLNNYDDADVIKQITNFNERVGKVEEANTEISKNVEALKTDNETNETAISELKETTAQNANNITSIQEEQTTQNENIEKNAECIAQNKKDVDEELTKIKKENSLLKSQIPEGHASGNSIHLEDSSNMDFEWSLKNVDEQLENKNIKIKVQNANYFDVENGFNYGTGISGRVSIDENGIITNTSNYSNSRSKGTQLFLRKNTDYYASFELLSVETESSQVNIGRLEIIFYDDTGKTQKALAMNFSKDFIGKRIKYQFNSADYAYCALHISGWFGSTTTGTIKYKDIMISENDIDYIEHEEQNVEVSGENIQQLHTYKNITNMSVDNDLAILDITYKKDIETMFNNQSKEYNERLSNIESLLNTTSTSALLLDNLEDDLEKEV